MKAIAFPLNSNSQGAEVVNLQEGLAILLDRKMITIDSNIADAEIEALQRQQFAIEQSLQRYGELTTAIVKNFQANNQISATGEIDDVTANRFNDLLRPLGLLDSSNQVSGTILLDRGTPAENLKIRLYTQGIGGTQTLLQETTTNNLGIYTFTYDPITSIELKAVNNQNEEISLCNPILNPSKREVLNLVVPSAKIQSAEPEYQRITSDLSTKLDGILLRDVTETVTPTTSRRDITLLNQATGWDARSIAIAATSAKLSNESNIPEKAIYGLLRVGFPADIQQLALANPQEVDLVLAKAEAAGIIALSDGDKAQVKAAIQVQAIEAQRSYRSAGALSPLGEFVSATQTLVQLDAADDAEKPKTKLFEKALLEHQGSAESFWNKLKDDGIADDNQINGLKLQGKLAYLTMNNAGLTTVLHQELGSVDNLAQLVNLGFYQEDTWDSKLRTVSGGNDDTLKTLIPPGFGDESVAVSDQLRSYSQHMAQVVRITYPTQVLRHMLDTEDGLRLTENHDTLKAPVQNFLQAALQIDANFQLGNQNLDAFIAGNQARLFANPNDEEATNTVKAVKSLQRLYQITPSHTALKAVSRLGFTSAHDITAFPFSEFMEKYGKEFRSREEAVMVYNKAQQVSSVTFKFFTSAKQLASQPTVSGIAAPQSLSTTKGALLKQFPSLESLFGSLDYCECEHCRSVLSPAAYFVDLLQLLDTKDIVWQRFLTDWSNNHSGKAYDGPEYQYKKPYDAIIERRPDIVNLPLTCENTNVALPYIDIVNEILEYQVANDHRALEIAYDTGVATTPELLAEPQNILAPAYTRLKEARYPLNVPFDLWLETSRQFFNYFETPLWQVLETFGSTEKLFDTPTDPAQFNLASIWAEYLGISPREYNLFTDKDNTLQSNWHELYGYKTEAEAFENLKSAKILARRLGVSYKELAELVQTNFINPKLNSLIVLSKLGVTIEEIYRAQGQPGYLPLSDSERADFNKKLEDLNQFFVTSGFNSQAWLNNAWINSDFQGIFVLADPNTGSNFDLVTLLRVEDRLDFSNGVDVYNAHRDDYATAFIKLNILVRLSRKLAWSIPDLDRSLQVFIPANALPLNASNLGNVLKTALVYIAHLQDLDNRYHLGKDSRQKLLAIWHPLFTTGKDPLYAQLFLVRSILKNDPIFDHPLGQYFSDTTAKVNGHLSSLQSALNLTASEINEILLDAGKNPGEENLSIDIISLLYRYRVFAKALQINVHEFIVLKALSGLNPFTPLSPDLLTEIDSDIAFSQTLKFVEAATVIKGSGFKIEDLDYLFRHQFDSVGKYHTNPNELWNLVKALSNEIQRIRSEHSIPSDAMSFTDETIQQKLSLIFPAEIVKSFMAMWTKAIEIYSDVTLAKSQSNPILQNQLEKLTIAKQSIGFLSESDFDQLFTRIDPIPESPNADDLNASERQIKEKRDKLAKVFLPFLQQRLIQQLTIQSLTTALKGDLTLVEALLSNTDLLSEPGQVDLPMLSPFLTLGATGVSATYYADDDTIIKEDNIEEIHVKDKPQTTNRIHFGGYLEAPQSGVYQFSLLLQGAGLSAEMQFSHLPNVFMAGKSLNPAQLTEFSKETELKAGTPYLFMIEVTGLADDQDILQVQVQSEGLQKDSLSQLKLYPQGNIERVSNTMVLLTKAMQIIQGLNLTERETRYLFMRNNDFGGLNLSDLPTQSLATSDLGNLFSQFIRLIKYSILKQELAGGADDLIDIFENSNRIFSEPGLSDDRKKELDKTVFASLCQKLARLIRRSPETVQSVVQSLGYLAQGGNDNANYRVIVTGFSNEQGLQKIWHVLQILEKLGVSIGALSPLLILAPDESVARNLRNTLKAKYEEDSWQRIAQPIFDRLRQQKRDALVAYIMHNHPEGFQNPNQLFEYFLIDPEMEPVVQTSRLRLAISSIQLFIQRSLLNLEKSIHPSSINAKYWNWMKRYRVWEANRKIFLFPENWLEPEFRDDKTHLFQELEGALLQGDVSNDLAEDAFFNYLKKLEILARLDIVTMYAEEHPDPAQNILHVIGRTYSSPHKYFYRRYANQMWTPWDPITTEIEGDHVVAVVWRGRLNLFWVTFLDKAKSVSPNPPADSGEELAKTSVQKILKFSGQMTQKIVEVQLNWSEYFQGEWTTRGSSGFGKPIRKNVSLDFDRRKVFIYVTKEIKNGEERAVNINLHLPDIFEDAFRVVSKNASPNPLEYIQGSRISRPYLADDAGGDITKYESTKSLQVWFQEKILTENGKPQQSGQPNVLKTVLHKGEPFSLLMPSNTPTLPTPEIASLSSPFFYADSRHTFFVEPSITITKTLVEWDTWVPGRLETRPMVLSPEILRAIPVAPAWPRIRDLRLDKQLSINPAANHKVIVDNDWLSNPATILTVNERLIGEKGSIDRAVLLPDARTSLNLQTGGMVTGLSSAVNNSTSIDFATVTQPLANQLHQINEVDPNNFLETGDQIHIIGSGGLNLDSLGNMNEVHARIPSLSSSNFLRSRVFNQSSSITL
jgi:peptidoglycan hydrolase-like protein with peptidoglycan-binding domain